MKVLITGVAGQLGHVVMNELAKRGYKGIGSDLAPVYSGVANGTPVTTIVSVFDRNRKCVATRKGVGASRC